MLLLLLSFVLPPLARPQATIEEVNDRQLERLTEDNDFVAVAWFTKTCK